MLIECYTSYPEIVKIEEESWRKFDTSVFANIDTVGKCGFVSCLEEKPIGFASWDPRNHPYLVIIGHNCILPEYQNRSFGRLQVLEMLRRFKKMRFKRAKVSTGSVSFFLAAQKMYLSTGFYEVERELHKRISNFEVIYYIKDL